MANQQYKNQKKQLRFSKKEIDRAARKIRLGEVSGEEKNSEIEKVQNFREFHLYPLMLLKNHLVRTSRSVDDSIIVARRLKRLSTIIDKLERPSLDGSSDNSIKLTRMQDIAGCRAIVKDLNDLKALQNRLIQSRSVHKIVSTKNYLDPKPSGYGGVHLIYSCYRDNETAEDTPWKGSKVEVQLRTELHHAWATSLEIIDTMEKISLKTTHAGHEEWREFFSIAEKLVASDEGAIVCDDKLLNKLRVRFTQLEAQLDVRRKLSRYRIAIDFSSRKKQNAAKSDGTFLVTVHVPQNKGKKFPVRVSHFKNEESSEALRQLNEADLEEGIIIAVLVSASDVSTLKKAYPNYFGSTQKFGKFVTKHIIT